MAQKVTATKTVVLNNMPATTASKVVELVVKDGALVADEKEVNPGVNSATLKN